MQKKFSYKYERCIVLKCSLVEPPVDDIDEIKSSIKINLQSHYEYIEDKSRLFIDLLISYSSEDHDFTEEIFSITLRHIFKLKSDEKLTLSHKDGNYLDINPEKLAIFTTWAISTSRGIIHQKLAGTRFSDVILPIVDERELRPQELIRAVESASSLAKEK